MVGGVVEAGADPRHHVCVGCRLCSVGSSFHLLPSVQGATGAIDNICLCDKPDETSAPGTCCIHVSMTCNIQAKREGVGPER